MECVVVEVTRGGVVESRHRVHAVAFAEGDVVHTAGDPSLVAFFRSASKPLQALPVVRARPDLDDVEIAIMCASHLARPEQLDAARSLLRKAPATEDDLECGPDPTRIAHNCSGKHAGMLALCRARGWPTEGYRLLEHPCQQAMLDEVAAAAELAARELATAIDGCGVVTFGLELARMARAFSRIRELEAGERVAAAMLAHPDLIRGPASPDAILMRTHPGWIAKSGAEGVLCAASEDGLALALKVEDGASRAVPVALAAFLEQLGIAPGEGLGPARIASSRGEPAGEIRAVTH